MKLSDFILANMEPILATWQELFRMTAPASSNRSYLHDHATQILAAIAADLALPRPDACRSPDTRACAKVADIVADIYGIDQLVSGCGVDEMMSEFRMLRMSVLRLWGKKAQEVDLPTLDDIIRFNDAIDQVSKEAIVRHALLARQSQNLFNDMLVHDLRNPLNAILMAADYLIRTNSLAKEHARIMSQILDSSQEMRGIVNDLLDFSRENFGAGITISPMQADLATIVRQAVEKIRQLHPGRTIRFESTGDLQGRWDHDRLAQAVGNLLENSLQHGSRTAPVTLKIYTNPDEFVLTVHNQGEPIPPGKSQYIFDALRRYSTSNSTNDCDAEAGLGLALYVARAIVIGHEGTISVKSALNEGTTFIVRLPRK